MEIITDIPNISMGEVIDHDMRGLKNQVSRELCTRNYQSLTDLMSDALSVEASKNSFPKVSIASLNGAVLSLWTSVI